MPLFKIASTWPPGPDEFLDHKEVTISFNNNRHHAVRFKKTDTPTVVADRLEQLARNIRNDRHLAE